LTLHLQSDRQRPPDGSVEQDAGVDENGLFIDICDAVVIGLWRCRVDTLTPVRSINESYC